MYDGYDGYGMCMDGIRKRGKSGLGLDLGWRGLGLDFNWIGLGFSNAFMEAGMDGWDISNGHGTWN